MSSFRPMQRITPLAGRAILRNRIAPAQSFFLQVRSNGTKPHANPTSQTSGQNQDVTASRANDKPGEGSTGGSTAHPVSQADRAGTSEEGGDPAKRDPNAPADQKRASVEAEGNKPLDPADK